MKQLDLLDPPTANTTVSRATKFHASTWAKKTACIEPFTAWDAACCIPDPAWVIPAELALPTDDEDWQPGSG